MHISFKRRSARYEALILLAILTLHILYINGYLVMDLSNGRVVENYRIAKNVGNKENLSVYPKKESIGNNGTNLEDDTPLNSTGIIYVAYTQELIPVDIKYLAGNYISGSYTFLHRGDGKYIVLRSDDVTGSNDFRIDIIATFNITSVENDEMVLYLKINATSNVSSTIYIYNQSAEEYQILYEINYTSDIILKANVSDNNHDGNVTVRIHLQSGQSFTAKMWHLSLFTNKVRNFKLEYTFISQKILEYRMRIAGFLRYTKLYMLNLSEWLAIKYIDPPSSIIFNYTERSILLVACGIVEIVFRGYDYWEREGIMNVSMEFYCGNHSIDINKIRPYYRLTYLTYNISNYTGYGFSRVIRVKNPTNLDLYYVPIKIVLNDSWFNMLALRRDASNIVFYIKEDETLERLKSILAYWDGVNAIYYVKLDSLKAGEEKDIVIYYGNLNAPTPLQYPEAMKMGKVENMSMLARGSMWDISGGYIDEIYYNDEENSSEMEVISEGYTSIRYDYVLSGVFELSVSLASPKGYVAPNFSFRVKFLYEYSDRYYCLEYTNNTASGHPEIILYWVNGTHTEIIDRCAASNVAEAFYVQVSLRINTVIDYIDISATAPYNRLEVYGYEDVLDISHGAWYLVFEVEGVDWLDLKILKWSQRVGCSNWLSYYWPETLEDFVLEETYVETDWSYLNKSTLAVKNNAIMALKVYDPMGNILFDSNISVNVTGSNVVRVKLNGSILRFVNEVSRPHRIDLWADLNYCVVHLGSFESDYIVIKRGLYILYDTDEISGIQKGYVIFVRDYEVIISVDNMWGLLKTWENTDSISIAYTLLDFLNGETRCPLYGILINYSVAASYVNDIIDFLNATVFNQWLSMKALSESELENLTLILSALNISLEDVDVLTLSSDGTSCVVEARDDNNQTHIYQYDRSLMEMIDILISKNIVSMALSANIAKFIALFAPITMVRFDGQNYSVLIRMQCGSSEIMLNMDFDDDTIHIEYTSLNTTNSYLRELVSLLLVSSVIANRSSVIFGFRGAESKGIEFDMKYKHIKVSFVRSQRNLYMDMNLIDRRVLISFCDSWNAEIDFSDLIVLSQGDIINISNSRLDCLVDPHFGGVKYRLCSNNSLSNFIEWILDNIAYRRLRLYDYYTNNPMELTDGILTIMVNDTVIHDYEFVTLKGPIRLVILDRWNITLANTTTSDINIDVIVKLGSIIIMNCLNVCTFVSLKPEESNIPMNYTLGPNQSMADLLAVGKSYNLLIEDYYGNIFFNDTIFLQANTSYRPLIVVIISTITIIQGSEINQSSESNESNGVEISVSPNIPRSRGIDYRIVIIILLAVLITVAIKIMLRKIRKRKVVEIEKLIEKIISDEE